MSRMGGWYQTSKPLNSAQSGNSPSTGVKTVQKAKTNVPLSEPIAFATVKWHSIPDQPGVYVIADQNEVVYVGMAGRNGKGSIRNRLRDHASGQIVNMFAQYLF